MSASTVNPGLTAERRTDRGRAQHRNRQRRAVENDDYAAFTRRILAAHARRIARGDIEGLTPLAALAVDVDEALTHAVTGLHAHGYSWTEIAARLGITRQAAHQRWARDAR
jgi:hypothetical protein